MGGRLRRVRVTRRKKRVKGLSQGVIGGFRMPNNLGQLVAPVQMSSSVPSFFQNMSVSPSQIPSLQSVTSGITKGISNFGSSAYNWLTSLSNQNKLLLLGIVGAGTYQAARMLYQQYLEDKRIAIRNNINSLDFNTQYNHIEKIVDDLESMIPIIKQIDSQFVAFISTGEDGFYTNLIDYIDELDNIFQEIELYHTSKGVNLLSINNGRLVTQAMFDVRRIINLITHAVNANADIVQGKLLSKTPGDVEDNKKFIEHSKNITRRSIAELINIINSIIKMYTSDKKDRKKTKKSRIYE